MNEEKIALVDMDGTLCDYEGALSYKMKEALGDEDANIWDPKYKKLQYIIKEQSGFWRDLEPIEFGMSVVKYLKETGWNVHILTKGPYKTISAWSEKVCWVRHWLPGIPITITENKGIVYGSLLIDDWPAYCESWLKWRPRGLVIMPSYDYNKDFAINNSNQVIRGDMKCLDNIKNLINIAFNREAGNELKL